MRFRKLIIPVVAISAGYLAYRIYRHRKETRLLPREENPKPQYTLRPGKKLLPPPAVKKLASPARLLLPRKKKLRPEFNLPQRKTPPRPINLSPLGENSDRLTPGTDNPENETQETWGGSFFGCFVFVVFVTVATFVELETESSGISVAVIISLIFMGLSKVFLEPVMSEIKWGCMVSAGVVFAVFFLSFWAILQYERTGLELVVPVVIFFVLIIAAVALVLYRTGKK